MPYREVNTRYAFSSKQQTAYGTVIPDIDLTEAHPADGYNNVQFELSKIDNANHAGKGHEFATRVLNNTASTQLSQSFPGSSYIIAYGFAFINGKCTTIQPDAGDAPNTYEHTTAMMDIDNPAVGKQLPATSFVEYISSGFHTKYRDMVAKSLKISGKTEEQLKVDMELIGSGHKETSSLTMPGFVQTSFLRFADVSFLYGATNVSARLKDFTFSHTNELAEKDGYHPGSGFLDSSANSPQVRGRCLLTKRTVELSFKMLMEDNLDSDLLANTERAITITAEGEPIEDIYKHKLEIQIPKAILKTTQKGKEDGFYVYDTTVYLLYDETIGAPYKAIIINTTPEYLALPA